MNVMSAGASSLAHGVHYGVLVVGLLGLLALLGPQWVGGPRAQAPRNDHERRVAELHQQIAAGALGTLTATPARTAFRVPGSAAVLLPVAVVGSTAAAGVHAALGPPHFRELPLFGMFFTATALVQVAWAVAVVLRPSRRLLLGAVVGNTGLLALWLLTRTVGLPLGLLPVPEPVGLWDLTCAGWEIAVVVAAWRLLQERPGPRLAVPPYDAWPSSTRLWALGSMVVLGALTVSGAGR